MMQQMDIRYDCRFFRGDIPCKPHKQYGVHCNGCIYYEPVEYRILIIKLGAIGDVLRTTPLLRRIRREYPRSKIFWLTYFPDAVPRSWVDEILRFSPEAILSLEAIPFDWVINLDKDHFACALTTKLQYQRLSGFTVREGIIVPADTYAEQKYLTGLFDDVSQQNTLSYLEEIFAICQWEFQKEEYIIEPEPCALSIPNDGKPIVALNPGCGRRWTARRWPLEYWIALIQMCQQQHLFPMLVGGEEDRQELDFLVEKTGVFFPGVLPLRNFFFLLSRADVLVTPVTMALHAAIGVQTPVVLFVNIFNPAEFELYDRGILLQPPKACQCYFQSQCSNPEYFCLDSLTPQMVFDAVTTVLQRFGVQKEREQAALVDYGKSEEQSQ